MLAVIRRMNVGLAWTAKWSILPSWYLAREDLYFLVPAPTHLTNEWSEHSHRIFSHMSWLATFFLCVKRNRTKRKAQQVYQLIPWVRYPDSPVWLERDHPITTLSGLGTVAWFHWLWSWRLSQQRQWNKLNRNSSRVCLNCNSPWALNFALNLTSLSNKASEGCMGFRQTVFYSCVAGDLSSEWNTLQKLKML